MLFVTKRVRVPSSMIAVFDRSLQRGAPFDSAAVAPDLAASDPGAQSTVTAAYEVSMSPASRYAASAGPRFAKRRAIHRGLRHGLDPVVCLRLPKPPKRGRCHGISKLNKR